ncbi:signal peptidase I [Tahibacter sp.]|uniref:signal peptidase I n=1 Tax=Tahibacter sp. TaxID=2056211 RepID=UPI0028C48604|nr:signal peptidase I [Tahibacter sp.]
MNDQRKSRRRLSYVLAATAAGVVVLVVVALVLVRVFFIKTYHIPQNGMYPGLPSGSFLFALKRPYAYPESVRRGDIVIFRRDEETGSYLYIWRVIGLPGDTIQTSGWGLRVNGHVVQRWRDGERDGKSIFYEQVGEASYKIALDESPTHEPPDVSTTVPAGHFFVMGDNRFEAKDSRYFGAIPFDSIVGKKLR